MRRSYWPIRILADDLLLLEMFSITESADVFSHTRFGITRLSEHVIMKVRLYRHSLVTLRTTSGRRSTPSIFLLIGLQVSKIPTQYSSPSLAITAVLNGSNSNSACVRSCATQTMTRLTIWCEAFQTRTGCDAALRSARPVSQFGRPFILKVLSL